MGELKAASVGSELLGGRGTHRPTQSRRRSLRESTRHGRHCLRFETFSQEAVTNPPPLER